MHTSAPHAPDSRAEVARADLLLDEAAALPKLLEGVGLSVAKLGAAVEEAKVAASSLRATDAIRALVLCDLRGAGFTLADLPESGSPLPVGFVQQLDARLSQAIASVQAGPERAAAGRISERLRALLLAQ